MVFDIFLKAEGGKVCLSLAKQQVYLSQGLTSFFPLDQIIYNCMIMMIAKLK